MIFCTGTTAAFADANTQSLSADANVAETDSALLRTLQAAYDATHGYFAYNDQVNGLSIGSEYGHTKGFVGVNTEKSFWVLHSAPEFPLADASTSYPSREMKYGQTFLCVSFDTSDLDKVGTQLKLTRPYVYLKHLSSDILNSNSNLNDVYTNGAHSTSATTSIVEFSAGYTTFYQLAKTSEWGQDFWEG